MIPDFNFSSVLPPFVGNNPAERSSVSPYRVEMTEIVAKLGFNVERREILLGLLDFRQELRESGITDGFQWLDGSFVEDVERIRSRPPADIDVVTFAKRPSGIENLADWREFIAKYMYMFDQRITKERFRCDAYFVDLDKTSRVIVDDTKYWYGLFSHQRETSVWKGMLAVSLDADDLDARRLLEKGVGYEEAATDGYVES